MNNEFAIEADDISKKFLLGRRTTSLKDRLTGFGASNKDEFWAFQNVSVNVPKGSMLGVIGRNGSGKSTFLRTLCGVYRPTTGEVRVRGRVTALLELGAGFHAELTGRENVYMNGSVVGLDRDYMDSVMDEIVDMADIGSFIDAPIETYSSGMRARLGFAVSVQMQPEILLADEITAVGDIAFKEHGVARMNELRDSGTTIVQVSHNLSMMQKSCDQVLWLHHGEVRRLGDPKEVVDEYKALASVDRSGRMIGGDTGNPKVAARRRKQVAVTETLAAEDLNSSWFQGVQFVGTAGDPDAGDSTLRSGDAAFFGASIRPTEPVSNPSVEVRVLAAGGTPTGFGFASGPLDDEQLRSGGLGANIDALLLAAGRYNLRIDLCSGDAIMATRHLSVQVQPADADGRAFHELPAQWAVTIDWATQG
ncbi:MAG: lipopolysaccharide transport system ATP-binding protein [Verrucomicrobiales bacterium]|jgi:lipopolysaccharide transport system ATP-binding protein